jgi:hypothetical protein
MNLAALTQMAQQMALDPQGSRYSGLYTQALNLAQQQFVLDSKCLWKDATYTIVAAQAAYSLPTDFLYEKKVTLDGIGLSPVSRASLEKVYVGSRWDNIRGTPTNYVVDPDVSKSQLLPFPIPTNEDAGKSLVMTYFAYPSDLANVADIPFNATPLLAQFHMALPAWAAWYLLQNEPATAEISQKKRELMQVYNDQVSTATETFKNTASELMRQRGSRIYV